MGSERELLFWAVGCVVLALVAYGLVRWRRRHTNSPRPPSAVEIERPTGTSPVTGGTPPKPLEESLPAGLPESGPYGAPRYPIVLAHGYFGFSHVGVSRLRQEYFRGVRGHLEQTGCDVIPCRVSPAAGIARRAEQLARQIDRIGAPRVNVIAHSMGGLDARYAISRLGLASKVASLTTVGTPHRGTPLADASALLIGDWRNVRRLLDQLGANMDGLYDLTTRKMQQFNAEVTDARGVAYASYVGHVACGASLAHPLLSPGYAYLTRTAGDNDGLVPVSSQPWGEVLGMIPADHWAQIGWSREFDCLDFYAGLARTLAYRGL